MATHTAPARVRTQTRTSTVRGDAPPGGNPPNTGERGVGGLTYLLTYLLTTYLFTYLLTTYWLAYLLAYLLATFLLTYLLTHSLTYLLEFKIALETGRPERGNDTCSCGRSLCLRSCICRPFFAMRSCLDLCRQTRTRETFTNTNTVRCKQRYCHEHERGRCVT